MVTLAAAALDEMAAANDRATREICPLLSSEAVAASFEENGPLTTQPMVEGRGPACGVPHPRHGGYLLVVQFQALAEWDQHLAKGQRLDGLGHPARIETGGGGASLYVLDNGRHAVVMYLAPDSDNAVAALLRVAAHVYNVTASRLIVSTA